MIIPEKEGCMQRFTTQDLDLGHLSPTRRGQRMQTQNSLSFFLSSNLLLMLLLIYPNQKPEAKEHIDTAL